MNDRYIPFLPLELVMGPGALERLHSTTYFTENIQPYMVDPEIQPNANSYAELLNGPEFSGIYEFAKCIPAFTHAQNIQIARQISQLRHSLEAVWEKAGLSKDIEVLKINWSGIPDYIRKRVRKIYAELHRLTNILVIGNLHLAALSYKSVSDFYKFDQLSRNNLAQEALVGLQRAAFQFDADYQKGEPLRFSTYALTVIPYFAVRALNRHRENLDISSGNHTTLNLINKASV